MKKSIIVIAGGGTGGHIYPGVSVAREIEKQDANCSVHFVGTPRGIEKNIVPKEGFPLHLIPVGQLHKSIGPLKRIKTMSSDICIGVVRRTASSEPEARTLVSFLPLSGFTSRSLSRLCSPMIMPV